MNSRITFRIALGTLALAAALILAPKSVPAQNNPDDALQQVTGCLQNGAVADTYTLLDENGKLWELQSKSIQFAVHVGQKVTLSGTIPEKPKNPAKPDTTPQNHLNVTDLKKLSDTCG